MQLQRSPPQSSADQQKDFLTVSEDFQTTAPVVQQTPADAASEHAVNVYLGGNPDMVKGAFDRASIEHRRSAPPETGNPTPDPTWRDGSPPLGQMPEVQNLPAGEVETVINKLNTIGGEHAALVHEWTSTGANVGEEVQFARAAYQKVVANDPGLIEAVDRAGLGNHPSVLRFLARQGRLDANMAGDTTVARNNSNSAPFTPAPFANRAPAAPMGSSRGSEETRQELTRLINENGPGTERYKDPAVQSRIQRLHQMLAGSGSSIVGRSGRTS
jgi:hypothetical protein